MFGRSWEPGTAKIVAKRFKESTETAGTYDYVADVSLASGQLFRTTLHQPPLMNHVVRLHEGEVVSVLADARRQRAKFDRNDPRVNGKSQPGSKDAFDEALKQPPSPPSG